MPADHPQFPGLPWIAGDLVVSREVMDAIEAHALAAYPSECCGFAFGPADQPLVIDEEIEVENEADKYHAMDPEQFPRTSKTYFRLNPMKAMRTLDEASAKGRPLKVIYHSHCDAGAYFSGEDSATFAQGEMLMWPCAFLVVSVVDGAVKEHKLWVHEVGTNNFVEAPIRIG